VSESGEKPGPVLASHRVPAHLARRFNQICLGVTAEILDREDLTPLLFGVVAAVVEEPGSGQRHLADRMGVDAVNLGQMIEILEQKGLVKRQIDPADRRARQLFVTRRGAELRRRLRPLLLAAQERLLAPLTKTERMALLDMLARVIEANDSAARPGNGRRKPCGWDRGSSGERGGHDDDMPHRCSISAAHSSKRKQARACYGSRSQSESLTTDYCPCQLARTTGEVIVTFPPAVPTIPQRVFADALSKKGKPVVEDRPGAEGTIGVAAFVSSQDDHTLLYTVAGSVTIAPLLIDKLPYDVDRDLEPIAATTAIVLMLAVSNELAVRGIPELIDALRSSPGKYAWTSGPTLPRYVFAAFRRNALR
jgi:DNA-binding MarR family transcriptional regulator